MPSQKDKISRHAHYLESYYNGEANKVDAFLRRVAKRLRVKLTQTQTVTSQARIKTLLDFTENLVKEELGAFTDGLQEQIELFADSEAQFAAAAIKDFEMVIPSPQQTAAAVYARPFNNRLLKDYLKDFTKEQAKAVRNAVSMGFYEGATTQQIIRDIVGTKAQNYKNGILNVTRTSAERMVRTALNHTSNVARAKLYDDNSDIVPFYEWVSTLDGRTSPICRSRDGKVYKIGKGKLPPAHPNCRSTTAPLFAEDVQIKGKELVKVDAGGKRASMDGQVSADLTYNEWFKKQSKGFQLEVLGKTRYNLFESGELTLDKFTNNRDQALTLDQLKAKYPSVMGDI